MKNVHKRFLSLIMTMMMILSCLATASAVNVADNTSAADDNVVVLNSTNGDEGIIPLEYREILFGSAQHTPDKTIFSTRVYLNGSEFLTLSYGGNCKYSVVIQGNDGCIREFSSNGPVYQKSIKDKPFAEGWYTCTVTVSNVNNFAFYLQVTDKHY